MKTLFTNGNVYYNGRFEKLDILVENGIITAVAPSVSAGDAAEVELSGYHIFPGFVDVHVHLREPGFSYKETIKTGTLAAAHGGYTRVCSMPNLSPVPDCLQALKIQRDIIAADAVIGVLPYGSVTVGEKGKQLSDIEALAPFVAGFSDDGVGVSDTGLMREAMIRAHAVNKIIASHCEDMRLRGNGVIHAGEYAAAHSLPGISSESEFAPLERDLRLAADTGAAYHVCHVSTKQSVELIRQAKRSGVNVTAETAPHYLLLSEKYLRDDGRFKMNPPLRSESDRRALLEGIEDGTIDIIATDHAPHSAAEKSGGLKDSLMGIPGLETAFPVLYTFLVKRGIITLKKLVELMHDNPSARFCTGGPLEVGKSADFTVYSLEESYSISSGDFLSMGKSTPFEGIQTQGKCKMTVYAGKQVY